ncbi:hypothetical protein DO659_03160 [Salmonella enterica subsp. enterica serovar Minnesota]|nr:hypothetical protein [Salmonella enterica subsp. enterica serovar Minnesota]
MKNIRQLYFKAKKSAQKLYGINAGTIHRPVGDDPDEDDALDTLAIKKAGFKRSDFFKPVRVDHLVVDDMPEEGVFDTAFCDRYKLAEDGKSWLLPAAEPEPVDAGAGENTDSVSGQQKDENATDTAGAADTTDDAGTEGAVDETVSGDEPPESIHNVNGEPLDEVAAKDEVSVATLPLAQRVLHIFCYGREENKKYLHHATTLQRRHTTVLEMEQDKGYVQNLLTAVRNRRDIDKLSNHELLRLLEELKVVLPVSDSTTAKQMVDFFSAWLGTEVIDRGILVKEWLRGNRISRIEKKEKAPNSPKPPVTQKTPVADAVEASVRPRRSEKPTFSRINRELACGFYDDLDLNNLGPAIRFAKCVIAEEREDWKRMAMTIALIPDIKDYDPQTIIELARKVPKSVLNGSPELRRVWCESFLAVYGVKDPDWYEYVPNESPATHEENAARIRQAGKRLRDIEAGVFKCDEEETKSAGELADEPATPEAVEQGATEHHPDAQPVDAEPQVDTVEAAYQKKRAELHEARKNIPPKNPVDAGKQLAAARGEYVEGISDPDDPKWVRDNYSASNEGEKEEVATVETAEATNPPDHSEALLNQSEPEAPETEPENQPPEPVTKVADGVFDVSAFFAGASNQGEKTENLRADNDDRSPEKEDEGSVIVYTSAELLLHEILCRQTKNNRLLEDVVAHLDRAEKRQEKLADVLFQVAAGLACAMADAAKEELG